MLDRSETLLPAITAAALYGRRMPTDQTSYLCHDKEECSQRLNLLLPGQVDHGADDVHVTSAAGVASTHAAYTQILQAMHGLQSWSRRWHEEPCV